MQRHYYSVQQKTAKVINGCKTEISAKLMSVPDLSMTIVCIVVAISVVVVVITLVLSIYLYRKKCEELKKLKIDQRKKREMAEMLETDLPVACPDPLSSRDKRLNQHNFGVYNEPQEEHIYAKVGKYDIPTTEL
jgi:hypothetical protein